MILAVDAGNTRIKWGWHDGKRWRQRASAAVSEFAVRQENPFARHAMPGRIASRVVVSNVAGEAVKRQIAAWTEALGMRAEWVRAEARRCGVRNLYETPGQLGPDRWAALIGARALHPGACLVVCAGTATTADLLNERGEFFGGVIFPGLDLMRLSLNERTGELPLGAGTLRAMPRNTLDAIETGCHHAQAGAIERLRRELPAHAACLISGGGGKSLAAALPFPARYVDNLVLEGLARIAAADIPADTV